MRIADKMVGDIERDYTDAEVIAALTEPMPDTGDTTALGEMRALNELLRALNQTRGKKRERIKEKLWAKGAVVPDARTQSHSLPP